MICIAIMAILFSVPFSVHRGHARLLRQADYRFALRNAENQLEALRALPFEQLPPALVTVGDDGWVQLPHGSLEPASLKVRSLAGADLAGPSEVKVDSGRLQLEPKLAGQKVIVDYAFYVADQGEAHRVQNGRVALENGAVTRVERVWLAQGDRLSLVPPSQYRLQDDLLSLDGSLEGKVVCIDYQGVSVRNLVRGQFAGPGLEPVKGLGVVKRFTVEEAYGDGLKMELFGLKVAP